MECGLAVLTVHRACIGLFWLERLIAVPYFESGVLATPASVREVAFEPLTMFSGQFVDVHLEASSADVVTEHVLVSNYVG
jgi:hypothetical protein